jgi:uncharacterized protein (DUF2141 family)
MKHLLWITLLSIFGLGYGQTGSLTVTISSFKNSNGKAQVALFNNADDYPTEGEKAYRKATVVIQNNTATVTFDNLPYGQYAVAVFHDENGNNKLDTNWMGIPNEGLGASNNAKGSFGPPKFSDAKVSLNAAKLAIAIKIGY